MFSSKSCSRLSFLTSNITFLLKINIPKGGAPAIASRAAAEASHRFGRFSSVKPAFFKLRGPCKLDCCSTKTCSRSGLATVYEQVRSACIHALSNEKLLPPGFGCPFAYLQCFACCFAVLCVSSLAPSPFPRKSCSRSGLVAFYEQASKQASKQA